MELPCYTETNAFSWHDNPCKQKRCGGSISHKFLWRVLDATVLGKMGVVADNMT